MHLSDPFVSINSKSYVDVAARVLRAFHANIVFEF